MVATLTRQGDSYAIVLDADTVRQLGVAPGSSLQVRSIDGGLLLSPVSSDAVGPEFEQALKELDDVWGSVFKKLAE